MGPPRSGGYRGGMRNRSGFTLLELTAALVLGGVLLTLATPAFRYAGDVIAVRAARDQLLQALTVARSLAPLHGGAELEVRSSDGRVQVVAAGRIQLVHRLHDDFRVTLGTSNGAALVTLRFDALGIGRMASQSIVLERGDARAGVSLSTYGRPRPW